MNRNRCLSAEGEVATTTSSPGRDYGRRYSPDFPFALSSLGPGPGSFRWPQRSDPWPRVVFVPETLLWAAFGVED